MLEDKVKCYTITNDVFDVSYYITTACDGYGVCVTKNSKDGDELETSSIRCLFQDKKRTLEFIEKIADGFVTPMSLLDVAYDYICSIY